jgi:hypothetical protein
MKMQELVHRAHTLLEFLFELDAKGAAETAEWFTAANELQSLVAASPSLDQRIPHHVWHFISDSDIRLKDNLYGAEQRRLMTELLSSLRFESPDEPIQSRP